MNNDLHGLILPPRVLLGILLLRKYVTARTGNSSYKYAHLILSKYNRDPSIRQMNCYKEKQINKNLIITDMHFLVIHQLQG